MGLLKSTNHGFGVVLSGLGNPETRLNVKQLAHASHVPLVESGTAGYLGQARVVDPFGRRAGHV